ncbi:MAG: DUF4270 family protein [Chitinophagales bacterium]
MKTRTIVLTLGTIIIFTALLFSACKKINDATFLGGDLIPVVDNVTTFDTTLSVNTYNDLFTSATDSAQIGSGAEHFVGNISNDPLFGKTKATMYLELKPASFPQTFDFVRIDSVLHFDSVVLVLDYSRSFGDTNTAQKLTVREVDQASDFRFDSSYLIRSNTFSVLPAILSSSNGVIPSTLNVIPSSLDDSVKAFQDTTINQLRIRLLNSFGTRLISYDTSTYSTDSSFRTKFKGFAISPDASTGNAVMGFNLLGANTKLAFYYHYKSGAITDTAVVSYFNFGALCAHANLIERDYSGSQMLTYQGGASPDNLVFIENTPGSFATIKIPALATISNRIVHRAELIMEQVYDPTPSSDQVFNVPDLLFLDAYDTAKLRYRSMPYDLLFDANGGYNSDMFGMSGKKTVDAGNNPITVWKFNITRYVQNYLTRKEPLYDLRLYAPFSITDLYRVAAATDQDQVFNVNSAIVTGRVRLGGGNHPTQRMRLHIIYSKL